MKIMILFFLSFLLCGCSVDYHLTIDEQNQIYEEILLKSENELDSQQIFDASWPMKVYYNDLDIGENPEPIEGISYYVNDVFLENNIKESLVILMIIKLFLVLILFCLAMINFIF